jgi:hypothetical protein
MTNLTAVWDENATDEDVVRAYQFLINTGQAWQLEGHVGRTAMNLIEEGVCALGPSSVSDYYGNTLPGRLDVEPGTMGSVEFVNAKGNEVME